jgi:MFS family permease
MSNTPDWVTRLAELSPPVTLTPGQVLRRHSDLRRVVAASAISDVGTWMQLMTVGTLIARETGSALRSGLVAVATFTPQIVSAPIGGALADRYDRRNLLRLVLAMQTVGALVLAAAIASGRSSTELTFIVLVQGMVGAVANPVFAAITPDLVPPDSLLAAASLYSVAWNTGRIVGPLLATTLIQLTSPAWAIVGNAASFAVLLCALTLLRREFRPAAQDMHESFPDRLRNGYRALRQTPTVRWAWKFACINQITVAPIIALVPIFALRRLSGQTQLASAIYVALGVGSLLGSWSVAGLVKRYGRTRVALGFGFIGGWVSVHSVIQRDAPPGERGRILSLVTATIGLCYGAGVVWMGALADASDIWVSLLVGAGAAGAVMLASLLYHLNQWRALEAGDPGSAVPVQHR